MTATEEPRSIHPRFLKIVEPSLKRFNLDHDAQRLVSSTLARATASIADLTDEQRDDALEQAARDLSRVVEDVTAQLRGHEGTTVSNVLLIELFSMHCPLPPFCFPEDMDELSTLSDDAGTGVTFRVPAEADA